MAVTISTASGSWGVWFPSDPKQIAAKRFLDEVSEAGYEYIELGPFGYLPSDSQELKIELAARQLKVCAATAIGKLEDPEDSPSLEKQVRKNESNRSDDS